MDLAARKSGGPNIVARPQARPAWYAPATVDAREVEVSVQRLDDAGALVGAPLSFGRFSSVAEVVIPHTPDLDCRLRVYLMPFGPDGTPGYSSLRDCPQLTVDFRRETDAPVIGQTGATATPDKTVQFGIANFTRFARLRRVTVSANPDMSGPPLDVILRAADPEIASELPRFFVLSRLAGALTTEAGNSPASDQWTTEPGNAAPGSVLTLEAGAILPKTVYVTVSHSGGGPWTPESNILELTFADGSGAGGSTGDFDPTPRDTHGLGEL